MKVRVKFTVNATDEAVAAIAAAVGVEADALTREQVKDYIRDNGIAATDGITVAEKAAA